MDSTASIRTVRLRRALGLSLFGAGLATVLSLLGGGSEARADGLVPVVDDLLGSVGAVVDTVQDPVMTVVDTVVTEVVAPVAVVADTVVDQATGAVLPAVRSLPGGPAVPGPSLPNDSDVPAPALHGLTIDGISSFSATADPVTRSTNVSDTFSTPSESDSAAAAPTPGPVGTSDSSIPHIAVTPSGSSGSSANSGGSAGATIAAENTTHFAFVLPITGRESARDDDLPTSPCSEFDTSPD